MNRAVGRSVLAVIALGLIVAGGWDVVSQLHPLRGLAEPGWTWDPTAVLVLALLDLTCGSGLIVGAAWVASSLRKAQGWGRWARGAVAIAMAAAGVPLPGFMLVNVDLSAPWRVLIQGAADLCAAGGVVAGFWILSRLGACRRPERL